MNKKGFTLVELLAVLVILGIISFIAVPNVIDLIDNNKDDAILADARKMVAQAKYEIAKDSDARKNGKTFSFTVVGKDLDKDPDGGNYNNSSSKVIYNSSNGKYCVYLVGSKRKVSTTTGECVSEENLYSRSDNVIQNVGE